LKLFRQVCEAVDYAHSQAIVHRDLKPANILVLPNGRPKLLDFGIAKVVDTEMVQAPTVTLARPATPQYASPEQLRGEPTTPASDVYSLGVLLYELLTEQSPYAGKTQNLNSISRAIYEQNPQSPSEVTGNADWKRNLDRVVAGAMQKDPGARYPSVANLITDIDRCLAGTAVQRHGSRTPAWQRGNLLWAFGLTVLALMVGLWFARKHVPFLNPVREFDQLYTQGMERQQHFDWPAARSLFRRAVEADRRNALGHYAYSAALETLGYESLAKREAKLAKELSGGLTPEKQLLIRGRYQEYTADRAGAVATYKKLWSLESEEYRLRPSSCCRAKG
jgi:serine/threonine protein kinase